MDDYRFELIESLNRYSLSENRTEQLEKRIIDLVCYIASDEEYKNDSLSKNLIMDAAQKLRVFGLTKGDLKIREEDVRDTDFSLLTRLTLKEKYRSKIYPNNVLDKRQMQVVNAFQCKKRLLVSAPTSFGKTFILREIIYINRTRYKNIILVFPTIALLGENMDEITELIQGWDIDYKVINNLFEDIDLKEKHIFILTPERTVSLFAKYKDLTIDFFFFDEVYKINQRLKENEDGSVEAYSEGDRGQAFRIVLYLLSKKIKEYYLAGPYLNLNKTDMSIMRYMKKNNISDIDINFEPTMKIEYEAWKKGVIEKNPIAEDRKIVLSENTPKVLDVLQHIKKNGWKKTLVYCKSPNSIAKEIDIIYEANRSADVKNSQIVKLLKHITHRYSISDNPRSVQEWTLVKCLNAGVGIHHGKIPRYIQKEMISLFNQDDSNLDVLFCTSTIIEGVNTDAQNIIIQDASNGRTRLDDFTLKNIKGRAGRYYHHSIGRIFYMKKIMEDICVDSQSGFKFLTYSDDRMLGVDYDNADIDDLSKINRQYKIKRDNELNKQLLPDDVFYENRLYDRKKQEQVLETILERYEEFEGFAKNCNIKWFLLNDMIGKIVKLFEGPNEKTPAQSKRIINIVTNYSKNGIKVLLRYYVSNGEKNIYDRAFEDVRNVVEYQFPNCLMIFESLFRRAYYLKNNKEIEFDISVIIRFFELGVESEFGSRLLEYGYPVETIRVLERELPELKNASVIEAFNLIRGQETQLKKDLDEYEIELLFRLINRIEKIYV